MPYFRLKGKPILPQNAECPVEVVEQSLTCSSDPFFKTSSSDNNGRIVLSGVSDSGYKLITADSNTSLETLKNQDAFEGKLKINNVVQKYCHKGRAPTGANLCFYNSGTYYFYRRYDGYCEIQDSNGSSLSILSTIEQKKKIYTFWLLAGGGSGTCAKQGFGWWGGGGGGGAGFTVFTLEFTDLAETDRQDLKLKIVVGQGGSAVSKHSQSGNAGGDTVITPQIFHSSFGSAEVARAEGGRGGNGKYGGAGGGASVSNTRGSNAYYRIIGSQTVNGANGGKEASKGGDVAPVTLYNSTVNSEIDSVGGRSGGDKWGGGNGGGGGGACAVSPGTKKDSGGITYRPGGYGGHGSEGALAGVKASEAGGNGYISINY